LNASRERDFATAFATLPRLRASGLVIGTDLFFNSRSEELAALAVRHQVPAILISGRSKPTGGSDFVAG
jgi:putative tryptophan/tyrosine transport system substrate-binding protein